jgi:hypothetical protein
MGVATEKTLAGFGPIALRNNDFSPYRYCNKVVDDDLLDDPSGFSVGN